VAGGEWSVVGDLTQSSSHSCTSKGQR
jgi:hypothetical protein